MWMRFLSNDFYHGRHVIFTLLETYLPLATCHLSLLPNLSASLYFDLGWGCSWFLPTTFARNINHWVVATDAFVLLECLIDSCVSHNLMHLRTIWDVEGWISWSTISLPITQKVLGVTVHDNKITNEHGLVLFCSKKCQTAFLTFSLREEKIFFNFLACELMTLGALWP